MCEIDKQRIHVILRDNVRNMKKAIDDMEVPCITASPANTRKVVGQCFSAICRIRKSHDKVCTLFQQNKK